MQSKIQETSIYWIQKKRMLEIPYRAKFLRGMKLAANLWRTATKPWKLFWFSCIGRIMPRLGIWTAKYKLKNSESAIRNFFLHQSHIMLPSNYNNRPWLINGGAGYASLSVSILWELWSYSTIGGSGSPVTVRNSGISGGKGGRPGKSKLHFRDRWRFHSEHAYSNNHIKCLSKLSIPLLFSEWRQFLSGIVQNYASEDRNARLSWSTGCDEDGQCYINNTLHELQDRSRSIPQMIEQFDHTVDIASWYYARAKDVVSRVARNPMREQGFNQFPQDIRNRGIFN